MPEGVGNTLMLQQKVSLSRDLSHCLAVIPAKAAMTVPRHPRT
jgi:hypothetical protein